MKNSGKPLIARRDLMGLGVIGAALGILTYRAVFPARAPDDRRELSVEDANLQASKGDIVLIDIRRPDEWSLTGIGMPAHPIDMRRTDFIVALQDIVGPDRTRPVALICARGVRSARLAADLRDAGFTNILDVPAGMIGSAAGPGWVAAGLPLKPYEDQ